MKYKVIINACSPSYMARAEEIVSFIDASQSIFDCPVETREAIVFYADEQTGIEIETILPFENTRMVKVKHYQPENFLSILEATECERPADMYIFTGDWAGNELAARFACRLKGSSLVAVEEIKKEGEMLVGIKKVYSGNLRGSFRFRKKPYCFSLARGMNSSDTDMGFDKRCFTFQDHSSETLSPHLVKYLESPKEDEKQLEKAGFVIAAGRGTGNSNEILRLQKFARDLGAELGVSRPVVMNAWAPLDRLIGASGTVISPEVCLALAVSGSPPFYYGIEKSKTIIAINRDEHAPIIRAADIVIIDDYKKVIDTLIKLAAEEKGA